DQYGAGDTIREKCIPIRKVAVTNASGRQLSCFDLDHLGPGFASMACFVALRPVLLAALGQCVPAKSIHTRRRAVRIETAQDRVRLHLEDGGMEEGDVLVGADGLHSLVRPLVAGSDEVRYSGQTCFRGVARYRAVQPPVLRELQGTGQRGGICPVCAETVYWWTALNAPAGQILAQGQRKALLLERFKSWPFGLEAAIAATPGDAILQNDLVDRRPAKSYAQGHLVLVGDAAHPTTPNLGQGANMAIADGIALARCLRDSASIPAALAQYQEERLPHTRQIVEQSWTFGQMCLWKSRTAVGGRELLLRTIPGFMTRRTLRQLLQGTASLSN
ncbi:MAG TPA: FAD-dependent monooxygenase, partial [Candidatus Udaeobacter sp.]|nr:FAD-dependent monooxygenase [Candidatus Udaeobacter sp.]